jgi:hypothetical protein
LSTWFHQTASSNAGSNPTLNPTHVPTGNTPNSPKKSQCIDIPGSTSGSSTPLPNPISDSTGGLKVDLSTETENELFVLFGVQGACKTLELAQIDVTKHVEDSSFFRDPRREYRRLRGFWRYWLSIWQLKYCDFVKVPPTFLLYRRRQLADVL